MYTRWVWSRNLRDICIKRVTYIRSEILIIAYFNNSENTPTSCLKTLLNYKLSILRGRVNTKKGNIQGVPEKNNFEILVKETLITFDT